MENWKQQLKLLKQEVYALYFACQHPGVPWYAKLLTICVVTYALSPIDLIPDFIPVIGYLDDLLLVPIGILLVLKLIPPLVMVECRAKAKAALLRGEKQPTSWTAATLIFCIWIVLAILSILWIQRLLG